VGFFESATILIDSKSQAKPAIDATRREHRFQGMTISS
jgi:hypothetical protein